MGCLLFGVNIFIYAYIGLRVFASIDFCGIVRREMMPDDKSNWRFIGLLLIIPFGFWFVYFAARKRLMFLGKWEKRLFLETTAITINVVIVFLIGTSIFIIICGTRNYAQDARRFSDMRQLAMMQDKYRLKNGIYLTCSNSGGDCGGQPNNYPQIIDDLSTPKDPSGNGSVCGKNFTYCGLDNTIDNGVNFCYYAKLAEESGKYYYVVSSRGYYKKSRLPLSMADCLSLEK